MSSWKSQVGQERGQDARRSRTNPRRMEKVRHRWTKCTKRRMERSGTVLPENMHIHDKGRMLSHDLLVEHVGVFFRHDARAHYRVRFCGESWTA